MEEKERNKFILKYPQLKHAIAGAIIFIGLLIYGSLAAERKPDVGLAGETKEAPLTIKVKPFTDRDFDELFSEYEEKLIRAKDAAYDIGFADGEEIGITKGKNGVRETIALQALIEGIPNILVSKITGIDLSRVNSLISQHIANPDEHADTDTDINTNTNDNHAATNHSADNYLAPVEQNKLNNDPRDNNNMIKDPIETNNGESSND